MGFGKGEFDVLLGSQHGVYSFLVGGILHREGMLQCLEPSVFEAESSEVRVIQPWDFDIQVRKFI